MTSLDSPVSYEELLAQNVALKKRVFHLESVLSSNSIDIPSISYCEDIPATTTAPLSTREPNITPPAQFPALPTSDSNKRNPYVPSHDLSNEQVFRYARHLILPEVGYQKQVSWCSSRVLIVGAGGLGAPVCLYLAAAGIGHITIIDDDEVDLTNLQRQVIHTERSLGTSKAHSARQAILALNSSITVDAIVGRFTEQNAIELVEAHDVVIDATDNVVTRYLLNDAAILCSKKLVSGSALRMEGQLTVYGGSGPCYRCLYPSPPPAETVTNCSDGGVVGVIPGLIGCLQALEALKILAGESDKNCMVQRLLLFDGAESKFRVVKLRGKNPGCAVCGENPTVHRDALESYTLFCNARANDKPVTPDEKPSTEVLNLITQERGMVKKSSVSVTQYVQTYAMLPTVKNSQDGEDEKSTSSANFTSLELYKHAFKTPHLLVDVRDQVQFDICSLPFSSNVPYRHMDLVRRRNANIVRKQVRLLPEIFERRALPTTSHTISLFENVFRALSEVYTACEILSLLLETMPSNTLDHVENKTCKAGPPLATTVLSLEQICARMFSPSGLSREEKSLEKSSENDRVKIVFLCRRGVYSAAAVRLVAETIITAKRAVESIERMVVVDLARFSVSEVWNILSQIWDFGSSSITEFTPVFSDQRQTKSEEEKNNDVCMPVKSTLSMFNLLSNLELINLTGGLSSMNNIDPVLPVY